MMVIENNMRLLLVKCMSAINTNSYGIIISIGK